MNTEALRGYPLNLHELPTTWTWVWLGEVIQDIRSGFPSGKHNTVGEGVPHLRPMNITRQGRIDLSDVRYVTSNLDVRLKDGDVLFNNTNSPELVGKTAVVRQPDNWAYSNHMTRLRLPDGLVPEFVAHQLHYLWMRGYFRYRCTNYVNQASFSSGPLASSVPLILAPVREQQRIVEAIEEEFARIQQAERVLSQLESLIAAARQSVLQSGCSGNLVDGQNSNDADHLLRQIDRDRRDAGGADLGRPYTLPVAPSSDLSLVTPPHWRIASLESLTDATRVIRYGILMPKEHVSDGVLYVRVKDLQNWSIDIAGLRRTSQSIAQRYARSTLQVGDLLVAIRGSYGRVAIVPDVLDGGNITQDTARIAPHPSLDPRYLLYYLGGPIAQRYYDRVARGVAVKGVNIADLRRMPVPVPPQEEQVAIADAIEQYLSGMDNIASEVAHAKERAARLRASVLAEAFAGRLAPQYTADEPAGVLLTRIASKGAVERAARRRHRPRRGSMRERLTKGETTA